MKVKLYDLKSFRPILIGTVLFLISLFVLRMDDFFLLFSPNFAFNKIDSYQTQLPLANIPAGQYFLSLGRPRGPCSVFKDNNLILSNEILQKEFRYPLALSSVVSINPQTDHLINIQCKFVRGFPAGWTTHIPVLVSTSVGPLLQMYREISILYLGTFTSMALLIGILTLLTGQSRQFGGYSEFAGQKRTTLLWFSIICFLYSASLAHHTRVVLDGPASSLVHFYLRVALSYCYISLLGWQFKFGKYVRYLYWCYTLSIFFVYALGPEQFLNYYKNTYFLFPLTTLLATISHFTSKKTMGGIEELIKGLSTMWVFGQIFDLACVHLHLGIYNAPVLVAFLSLGVFFIAKKDIDISRKTEHGVLEILDVISGKIDLKEALQKISKINHQLLGYKRVSAYLDMYALGESAQKAQGARRIYENGYEGSKHESIVHFQEGQGNLMKKAALERLPVDGIGKDGGHFIIFPIGDLAWINLSNDNTVGHFSAGDKLKLAHRLKYINASFESKIHEYVANGGEAVSMVKAKWGEGTWQLTLGAIFADIVDYSFHNNKYGENKFGHFVDNIFIPSLIRCLHPFAVPERFSGDEVYLIVLGDKEKPQSVVEDTTKSVARLLAYLDGEGTRLCQSHGFPPIEMTIGVNVGPAILTCDKYTLRSAGDSINLAKRLQKLCPKGKVMSHQSLVAGLLEHGLTFIRQRAFMEKKDFFEGAVLAPLRPTAVVRAVS